MSPSVPAMDESTGPAQRSPPRKPRRTHIEAFAVEVISSVELTTSHPGQSVPVPRPAQATARVSPDS